MSHLPTGTVTFLFSDIQGSTQLLQKLGEQYAQVLQEQHELLREAFAQHSGVIVDTQGDSFFVAFPRAQDAVNAAVKAQRALFVHEWGNGIRVNVRMGLHTGEPALLGERYVGMDVHRAARIGSAGHGGQVLVSESTQVLLKNDLPPDVTLRALGEHRLKDLRTPKHLYQLVIADLPSEYPPLKTLATIPNNLPVQLTNFIGRAGDIEAVRRQLMATRFVTLTGPGGSGKTRLSLQVAGEVLEQFRDGVWFVELAPLADPALVPETIASVMGVREQTGEGIHATLTNYLRNKVLLLLLDNCEHLIDACAEMADSLLRACPQLKILATSREALGIAGEVRYRVPALSLPDAQDASPETLSQYEAVRLFIDRAVAVESIFRVTNQNAPAVAQICMQLDGIPLAIELAAARVRGLSVKQIAARLDDRFRLLTGGSRTALPRQHTLRGAIDWSYKLLSPSEQAALRRVSVFAGGWTLEAAEFVCEAGELKSGQVFDILLHLVDKSLVVADTQGTESRYHMLETIRQYAREKLDEAGETIEMRNRQLEFSRQLATPTDLRIKSADQLEWLDRLDAEHANMRAALNWAAEGGSVEAGLNMAESLWAFWVYRGHMREGRESLAHLLALSKPDIPIPTRAKAHMRAGILASNLGEHAASQTHFEQSILLWKLLGTEGTEGLNEVKDWMFIFDPDAQRDPSLAGKHYQVRLKHFRQTGDQIRIADMLQTIGILAARQGDLVQSRRAFEESVAIFRATGDQIRLHSLQSNLAYCAFEEGNYEEARMLNEEALRFFRRAHFTFVIGDVLALQGAIAIRQGDYPIAKAWYTECLQVEQGAGVYAHVPECLIGFAAIAAAARSFQRAARLWGAAEAKVEEREGILENFDQVELKRLAKLLSRELGKTEFTRAGADGRALKLEQVIALSLEENEGARNDE